MINMKKCILSGCLALIIAGVLQAQNFYQLPVRTIDGDTIRLSEHAGKKILFTLLPLSQQDSIYQQVLDFRSRYGDTVVVIGILSGEDGYSTSAASSVRSLYAGTGIILTEGMQTRKSSGSSQSPLLQWLTDKSKNQHYDMDATGIGHKFFVSGAGRLFASLSKQSSFHSPIINRIVHSNAQGQ